MTGFATKFSGEPLRPLRLPPKRKYRQGYFLPRRTQRIHAELTREDNESEIQYWRSGTQTVSFGNTKQKSRRECGAGCRSSDSGGKRTRPCRALELQAGKVRILFCGNQRALKLMCMTRMEDMPKTSPFHPTDAAFPSLKI